MGSYKTYQCDTCKDKIELGGPETFRFNWRRKKVLVRHHDRKHKIDGLWILLWCKKCQRIEKKVIAEFERSCDALEVWGRRAPMKKEFLVNDPERFLCKKCSTYMLDKMPYKTECECGGIFKDTGRIQT